MWKILSKGKQDNALYIKIGMIIKCLLKDGKARHESLMVITVTTKYSNVMGKE